MACVPLATGARLLGIHPKTLRHWLTMAHLPLVAHPTDARIRCVAQAALLEVARLHGRPLPALPGGAVLEQDAVAPRAAVSAHDAPPVALAEVLQQLAQLHAHVATVQHQLARLTLELLPERTGGAEQHLQSLQALVSAPVEAVQPLLQIPRGTPSPPEHRLLPVELRARSRVTALIEYGAHGQYVAVCPRRGVLSLVPDAPAWFDWLATLSSFRFLGPAGRFSACRASKNGQYTRSWAARRLFHGHDFWHYLGVTDHLTLTCLEQAAAALQARIDAL